MQEWLLGHADAMITALASGSGDHAGLARLAEAAAPYWHAANLACGGNPIAVDLVAPFVGAMSPAVCSALLAENAALRGERDDLILSGAESAGKLDAALSNLRTAREDDLRHLQQATEAERKLAEAVGHLKAMSHVAPRTHEVEAALRFLGEEAA